MAETSRRDPADYLPLTPAMFHVLVAIADEHRHGYAIIKDVSGRTDGKVELGTGTLYGIVKRLLADAGNVDATQAVPPTNTARTSAAATALGMRRACIPSTMGRSA